MRLSLSNLPLHLPIQPLDRLLGRFHHQALADLARIEPEGEGRDGGDFDELPLHRVGLVEEGDGAVEIEEGVFGLVHGLLEEGMIGLVFGEHLVEQVGAPADLAHSALAAGDVSRDHQSGLGDAGELPLHELGIDEGGVKDFPGAFGGKQLAPFGDAEILEAAHGKEKPVVVEGDEGVAADGVLESFGQDAGKGVVGAATDEAVEEKTNALAVLVFRVVGQVTLDEETSLGRNLREKGLSREVIDHGGGVGVRDRPFLDEPIGDEVGIFAPRVEPVVDFGAEGGDGAGHAGGEGHLVGVPARHGGKAAFRILDEDFGG